jgi:hypothetical protein
MRIVGRGHPAIRATHDKTLEFSPDAELTERATCIVATRRGEATPIAGDVHITLRVGSESYHFDARGNSSWDPGGAAVIRRSALRLPDTFATHASAAAADLPRALAAALRDPEAEVELLVERSATQRPCAVWFALDPSHTSRLQLTAELSAADLVVAEDDGAASATGMRASPGDVPVEGRVLVLATQELPGRSVAAALRDAAVETVGLAPPLAAAAASPSRGPLVLVPADADPRVALRDAPAAARVVLPVPPGRLAALLRLAAEVRGTDGAVFAQPNLAPVRVDAADAEPGAARRTGFLCLDAAVAADALDPRVRAALDTLLADGVTTRTAANALAALTGWDRRRAYTAVLDLQTEQLA